MTSRHRHRAWRGAAALSPLTLGLPLAAQAQQAPGSGSFAGSFLIPGTNTSLKIGGYAKVDYLYDFGTDQDFLANGAGSGALASAIALNDNVPGTVPGVGHNIRGVWRPTAAESRINIETRTPTGFGELKTAIEGDFEGVSGVSPANTFQTNSDRSAFALRLAYGTLGPFLAGQTSPLFRDPDAAIETLEFGGAITPPASCVSRSSPTPRPASLRRIPRLSVGAPDCPAISAPSAGTASSSRPMAVMASAATPPTPVPRPAIPWCRSTARR